MSIVTNLMRGAIIGGVLGASATVAHAQVEFMSWTVTEETGEAAINSMIESFDGEVEAQGYAWGEMNRNYLLRSRSGTAPDVGQSQGRLLPIIANLEGMQDLNDVIGRETLLEMFDEGFLAMGEVDGRQVALPWITGTIGMVANREVLDAAGVDDIPVTVDEFREALVAVRDNVPNAVPLGLATKNANSILLDYMTWVWIFGGDPLNADGQPDVNSPEAIAALDFMASAVQERLAAPEIDRPDARRLFAQGATAFYIDAPVARTFARQFSGRGEEIDPAVVPIRAPVLNAGDTPVSLQWGHVLVLFGDENGNADSDAARWMMHLLADEQLIDYAVGQSVLPATRSGIASDAVEADQYLADWAATAVAPRRNSIASLENGAEIATIIGEEYQAAILGQKSAEEAANDMQSRLEEAMN